MFFKKKLQPKPKTRFSRHQRKKQKTKTQNMLKKTQLNPPRGLSGKPLVDLLSERVPAIVKTTGTQIQLDRETNVRLNGSEKEAIM